MTELYCNPYDFNSVGFYFNSMEEFNEKIRQAPFEEYSIDFIDGDDAALFEALSINAANLHRWFEEVELLDEHEKVALYYTVGYSGYSFEDRDIETLIQDTDIYETTLRGLAEEFAEEGIFPAECPESVLIYLDYDKLARDLSVDYSEFRYNGKTYCGRCC
jgi:hypothetical protein